MQYYYKETFDYSLFDFYKDNRETTEQHVNKLVESFKNYGQMQPILCSKEPNGKLMIVDGQNRLLAAKALGTPIKYIVDNKLNSHSVTEINSTQKNFSNLDWIKRYAAQGKQDYVELLRQIDNYKGTFSVPCCVWAYASNTHQFRGSYIREGNYKINVKRGTKTLNLCLKMYSILENKDFLKRIAIMAVAKLMQDENFDENRLLKNIKLKKFNVWPRISDTYNELVSVYNYNLKSKNSKLRKIA